jgi:type III pantothenate kinase
MREHGALILEEIATLNRTQWKQLAAPDRIIGSNVAGEAVRRRGEDQLGALEHHTGVDRLADLRMRRDQWLRPAEPARTRSLGSDHRSENRAPSTAVLVVTVGTAVTMDAVDETGRFIGGLILPGSV